MSNSGPTHHLITNVNISNNYQPFSVFEIGALVAAFLVFRCLLIVGLYALTGGQELASDVVFHELIIKDPLGILKGTAVEIASYPPFQWLIESSLFNLYNMLFGEMVSYRLLMVSVEFLSFVLVIVVCDKARLSRTVSFTLLFLFIVSPHQHFASVFFIQEDVIAQLFMLAAFLFILLDRRKSCIATLVAGVLIAKLFFVVPLFYVILFHGDRAFARRVVDGLVALVPLVIVYVFIITQALNNGGEVPIRDFTPDAKYAANYWVLLIDSDPVLLRYYKNLSLVFTALVQLSVILVFILYARKNTKLLHPVVLMVIPLAFFFGTFYQHMPEYLLMLWPLAALLCTQVWQQWVLAGAISFAWAPRIFHGLTTVVEGFGSAAEARSQVVGPFVEFFRFDYIFLNQAALVVQSVVYTLVVVCLCWLGWNIQRHSR